ncbi:MAG TPA: hypothetical protein VKK79_00615 [Candidatus Lokiarchaeia archaeon]|nr:hypothetical protein [Candidatus Lokiarchaeia archaeon]
MTSNTTVAGFSPAWDGHERRRILVQCRCPVCGADLHPGVERRDWEQVTNFPYRHIVIHGSPLHAVVVYLDANFAVRGVEAGHSIEVEKNQDTLQEILHKWANPS